MAEGSRERAAAARGLMRRARHGTLATAETGAETGGAWPYASLVTVACDCDGSPILLLSRLADHTRNILDDARASILFEAASGLANPQTGPRVTVVGRIEKTTVERHARRFLARHPRAREYAGFPDFAFYRMTVERGHYVGGFAAAAWIQGAELVFDARASATIAAAEEGIVEHMNRDHADAVALYATRLLGRRGKAWRMIAADPEGIDLRLRDTFQRLDFDAPVADASECRDRLVALAKKARAAA